MLVATKKIMSRQIPEAEGKERLVANKFGVATQDIPIVTRTRQLHQNYVATLSKSVDKDCMHQKLQLLKCDPTLESL